MTKKFNQPIHKVAVIGAGTMGAAIAQHFMMKGLDVVLVDVQQAGLDKGRANISTSLEQAVKRRILSEEKKQDLMNALYCSTDYSVLQDRQFVVEAVFENMAVKQQVFAEVEAQVADDCLIASNTSSFSITDLGAGLKHRDRFLGVHYFYHAAKNKLVELIPGKDTAQSAVAALSDFYYDRDKVPIVVADVYGFAVNRFFVPWLNEAVRLYEEGVGSITFIDKVARELFGIGMGPFALMNATGVPITMHSARTLEAHFGPLYAPAQRLVDIVESGQQWDLADDNSPHNDREAVGNRLLAMSLGIAAQMVSEGVADATDTDLGARLGLRWPAGPFELINRYGVDKVKAMVAREFARYDQPLPAIFEAVDLQRGFVIEHVKAQIMGNVGLLEFYRPDAMNALNPSVVECFEAAFDQLDGNPALGKIVLFGRGKAFVAGADIKFFIDNIKTGRIDAISSFAANGQALLNKIAASEKQTIAYLDGLTLGGGLELALACDRRVATKRMKASFPETGIGIYPGLGGTQRSTHILGKGLAKYLVATGAMIDAEQALGYGLVSAIVETTNNLEAIAALEATAARQTRGEALALAFAEFDGNVDSPLVTIGALQTYNKALSRKAPLALRKAMTLMDEGEKLTLDKALDLELEGLAAIFATEDALTGLECVIAAKAPVYRGK